MSTSPQPVSSILSKSDLALRCPAYAGFLDELRRLRRTHNDAPVPGNDPTIGEQLYASFKTFCSTYRRAHPDEDGSYATLWPIYLDRKVLNPKQSRQKRRSHSTRSQPATNKVPRTTEPSSSSSSSFDLSLLSPSASSSTASSSLASPAPLCDHAAGFPAVLDGIDKLRAELRQFLTVKSAPHTGVSDDVRESTKEEMVALRAQVERLQDADTHQRRQIEQLTQQLTDKQGTVEAALSDLAATKRQLDDTQQRWHQLEREHQELHEQLQQEKDATRMATEKAELSILQGYVLRACDELVIDCPQ